MPAVGFAMPAGPPWKISAAPSRNGSAPAPGQFSPVASKPAAPMMMSSEPSPLTSPAPSTADPPTVMSWFPVTISHGRICACAFAGLVPTMPAALPRKTNEAPIRPDPWFGIGGTKGLP